MCSRMGRWRVTHNGDEMLRQKRKRPNLGPAALRNHEGLAKSEANGAAPIRGSRWYQDFVFFAFFFFFAMTLFLGE